MKPFPFVTYPMNSYDQNTPAISIIIPVCHEAHIINPLLAHLFNLPFEEPLEIIIVDGDKDGSTLSAVRHAPVLKITSHRCRGLQLNRGAAAAKGNILLFLHADTRLPQNGLSLIVSALKQNNIFAGAFDLSIESNRAALRLIGAAASLRSRITKIPYGDQAVFIKKKEFDRIGGFAQIPIMEDVDLMRRIKKAGHRIKILPQKVRTSPRRWEKEGVWRCTFRNWALVGLYLLGVSPHRLARYYH